MKTYLGVLTFLLFFNQQGSAFESKIGTLFCPEFKVTDQVPGKIRSCPLLIAGFSNTPENTILHAIDSRSEHYYIPYPTVYTTWPTNFSETMMGALESNVSNFAGIRHSGLSRVYTWAALRIAKETIEDTVPLRNLFASFRPASPATTASACLDTLASQVFYGHVNGNFLRGRLCEFTISRYYQDGSNRTPSLTDSSKEMSITGLYAAAKPFTVSGSKPDWIWADLSTQQGSLWLLRQADKPDFVMHLDTEDVAEVESIRVEDIDGDGLKEFLFTTKYYYGDGDYKTLCVIKIAKDGKPTVWQHGIDGSSGEAGGSTVVAEWWLTSDTKSRAKLIYMATAQEGNDGGQSHDLQIQAFAMTPQIAAVKQKHFFVVLFGKPESKHLALERMAIIGKLPTKPAAFELRVLPRFTDSRLQWQAGALAPNAKTAKAWTKLEKTGSVYLIKSQ